MILYDTEEIKVVIPEGEFRMTKTWDPPISIHIESVNQLIRGVKFKLNERDIDHFTIEERLVQG